MEFALRLARRGAGLTEPNPLVGAVVARRGRIVAAGWHRAFGAAHAEAMALAGVEARGATLYTTLEPCDHHGKTPPCSELVIARGLRRVVVAMGDPNPLVAGRGLHRLQQAGIGVEVGLLGDRAAALNRHYLTALARRRPYVAVHAGMSLDGKLSDGAGRSRWVTSAALRRLAHGLRGEFSAILAGRGTVQADDPLLTLREPGWPGKRLARVVLDSGNVLDGGLQLFRQLEGAPLFLFSSDRAARRQPRGERHFFVSGDERGLSLPAVLGILFEQGIHSLLVEGGGRVIDSFLQQRLVDEMALFIAPRLVGGRQAADLFASGVSLAEALDLDPVEWHDTGAGYVLRGVRTCSPALS